MNAKSATPTMLGRVWHIRGQNTHVAKKNNYFLPAHQLHDNYTHTKTHTHTLHRRTARHNNGVRDRTMRSVRTRTTHTHTHALTHSVHSAASVVVVAMSTTNARARVCAIDFLILRSVAGRYTGRPFSLIISSAPIAGDSDFLAAAAVCWWLPTLRAVRIRRRD